MTYTTAEKSLIDIVVYEQIIEFMADADVSREIFPVEQRNAGDSIKIVKESSWSAAEVVAEGAEVSIQKPDYTESTETYKKIGYRTQITHEMLTDARWDLVRRAARKAGQQLALKMSIDVLREAWNGAGIHYSVSGRWGGANADEISDIANCIGLVMTKNYRPDLLVVHPKDYAHLKSLDEFIHQNLGGNIHNYDVGSIMNLRVLTTPMISENNFLMLDRANAGVLFIREDLRQAPYTEVTRDVEGQVFFIRYREATVAPSAICYATGY